MDFDLTPEWTTIRIGSKKLTFRKTELPAVGSGMIINEMIKENTSWNSIPKR